MAIQQPLRPTQPGHVTVAEAATILRVSPQMVRKAIGHNTMPAEWVGWRWEIPMASLTMYAERQRGSRADCARCHGEFIRKQPIQIYCSVRCYREALAATNNGLAVDAPRAGRFFKQPLECEWCGEEYMGFGRQQYCSTTCRVQAFFDRHGVTATDYTYRGWRAGAERAALAAAGERGGGA